MSKVTKRQKVITTKFEFGKQYKQEQIQSRADKMKDAIIYNNNDIQFIITGRRPQIKL